MMISVKNIRVIVLLLVFASALGTQALVSAQDASKSPTGQKEEDTNLDTQLYLIIATNRDAEEGKTPLGLEPVMKRLRESLPFKHYTLAATFLNRVRNGGRLDVSWVGGPLLVAPATSISNPSFNQFGAVVRLATDASGNEIVRLTELRFGSRVPIVTAQIANTNASTNAALPVINYESVGLRTDISIREDLPVIAGTLNVGPSGDALVVAIAARRAN